MRGNGKIFDRYKYDDKNNSNCHQRFTKGEKLRAAWVNASDLKMNRWIDQLNWTIGFVASKSAMKSRLVRTA